MSLASHVQILEALSSLVGKVLTTVLRRELTAEEAGDVTAAVIAVLNQQKAGTAERAAAQAEWPPTFAAMSQYQREVVAAVVLAVYQ